VRRNPGTTGQSRSTTQPSDDDQGGRSSHLSWDDRHRGYGRHIGASRRESSAQQVIMQIAGTTLRMEDAGAKPLLTRPRPFAISCYASPTFSDELAEVMWDSYVLDKN
jgi:hypothetical protein